MRRQRASADNGAFYGAAADAIGQELNQAIVDQNPCPPLDVARQKLIRDWNDRRAGRRRGGPGAQLTAGARERRLHRHRLPRLEVEAGGGQFTDTDPWSLEI